MQLIKTNPKIFWDELLVAGPGDASLASVSAFRHDGAAFHLTVIVKSRGGSQAAWVVTAKLRQRHQQQMLDAVRA